MFLETARSKSRSKRLRRPSGGVRHVAGGWGKAPPATSPGVGVVPGRQGQAAARSRQAASLDPHPSDSAPQAPARASGAFSVKGGSRGWCGPQPRRGRGHGLDATGATQACRQGVGGALPRHPCPSARGPRQGSPEGAMGVRCGGTPCLGFKGRAAPLGMRSEQKPSAEGEHFLLFELRFWLFKRPQRGLIYRYRRGRGES